MVARLLQVQIERKPRRPTSKPPARKANPAILSGPLSVALAGLRRRSLPGLPPRPPWGPQPPGPLAGFGHGLCRGFCCSVRQDFCRSLCRLHCRFLRDVEDAVVVRLIQRRPRARRSRSVGMGATAVLLVDDMPICGKFVAAHPEHCSQRSRQRQEEPAVATHALGGARHRRVGTVVAFVPSFGCVRATPAAHHPAPAQPDFSSGLVDLRVATGGIAGDQPRVVRRRRRAGLRGPNHPAGPAAPRAPTRGASSAVGPGISTTSLIVARSAPG